MEQAYTISIFSENSVGLLNRITSILTRRNLNIDSINSSESETSGIYRFTIVVYTTEAQIKKLVLQIEKQIEVMKAVYHTDGDTVFQEIALYKISTQSIAEGNLVEKLIRDNNARILSVESDFMIIEKTGHKEETQELLEFLKPYEVLEFVRSGRVSVTKPMGELEGI